MFNFPLSRVGSGGNETQNCLLGSGEYAKTLDIDKRTLGDRGRRGSAPAQSGRTPREAVSSCAHHAATSLGPMATPQSPAGDSLTARQESRTLRPCCCHQVCSRAGLVAETLTVLPMVVPRAVHVRAHGMDLLLSNCTPLLPVCKLLLVTVSPDCLSSSAAM